MPRYYFHVRDGVTTLDDLGVELADMKAVRQEAVTASGEMLRAMQGPDQFWSGEPWTMWVTDQANGAGATMLTLEFTATVAK